MRKLNRLTLTLVALLSMTTGAWAGEEPQLLTTINASSSFLTGSQTFDDIATVTFGGAGTIAFNNNNGWIQNEYNKEATVTVTAVDGYTITRIKIYSVTSSNATISTSPFTAYLSKEGSSTFVMTGANGSGQYVGDELVRIEVYGYQPEPEITEWSLTPDTDKKVWTLAEMPANDVELQVEYFAESNLFLSKDALADKDNIVVKNGETTVAFDDNGKSADPVTEGNTVTAKFTGKKVLGMKVKKGGIVLLSAATKDDIGKVVCAAGHLHEAKTAVPDGCTAVGILGQVTETGHGLILSLQDATNQNCNTINGWTSASYAGTTLKVLPDDAARGTNLTSYTTLGETTVSNWAVAQQSDYEAIFTNLGSMTGDGVGKTYDGNVNAFITTGVGGTEISGNYWSATEDGVIGAWSFNSVFWSRSGKSNSISVRPVLGF